MELSFTFFYICGNINTYLITTTMKKAFTLITTLCIAIVAMSQTANDYLAQARGGDATSQLKLADIYYNEENYDDAYYWYRCAAEQGNAEAQNKLGCFYFDGYFTEKNVEKARYWFLKSAEQNNPYAQFNMGLSYDRNESGYCYFTPEQEDQEKAIEWYMKAAQQGNAKAQMRLGFHYRWGWGVNQDIQQALYWYNLAAEQGDCIAMYRIGMIYLRVEHNFTKFIEIMEKSAQAGCINAASDIADLYLYGIGTAQDIEKAIYWYKKAPFLTYEDYLGETRYTKENIAEADALRNTTIIYENWDTSSPTTAILKVGEVTQLDGIEILFNDKLMVEGIEKDNYTTRLPLLNLLSFWGEYNSINDVKIIDSNKIFWREYGVEPYLKERMAYTFRLEKVFNNDYSNRITHNYLLYVNEYIYNRNGEIIGVLVTYKSK